ncbi:A disintegrin and metalloproteinase with thrombospondin motifs 18 isoform X1, partial [Tachysurus ichikawai]
TLQLCYVSSASASSTSGLNHDYMFITPVEVDSLGSYVTHDLSRTRHRSRRSLEEVGGHVHYHLSTFGEEIHLELRPSGVISEEFTVQTLSEGGVRVKRIDSDVWNCFYQGSVRNHTGSSAAVSTCTGLVSHYISSDYTHYTILLLTVCVALLLCVYYVVYCI